MEGAAERFRLDGERDIALAHTIASFTRAKKLEPLTRYLRPKREPVKSGSMLASLQRIAAATEGLG